MMWSSEEWADHVVQCIVNDDEEGNPRLWPDYGAMKFKIQHILIAYAREVGEAMREEITLKLSGMRVPSEIAFAIRQIEVKTP